MSQVRHQRDWLHVVAVLGLGLLLTMLIARYAAH
jgi:hypothetical protein